jgi:perosamine synthetase
MKPVFHSLGSNYSKRFIFLALQQLWSIQPTATQQVQQLLENKYHGRAYLFYKGRDAIEFTLRAYGIGENAQVLTQAFTCHAIEEAIVRAGAKPVFVDLEKNQLNPSVATLQAAYKKFPRARAVLIQHTLGYPAEIQRIAQWCRKNKLLLIEDLAQALGAQDADGIEVGTYADVVVCSFGRDKVIDAITGGAVILRQDSPFFELAEDKKVLDRAVKSNVPKSVVRKDLFYPLLTWMIRSTHQIGVGKILFQLAKALHLFTSPILSPTSTMSSLPVEYAPLVLWQFQHVQAVSNHRQEIAELYLDLLGHAPDLPLDTLHSYLKKDGLQKPAYLRFALAVPQPVELAKSLLKSKIHLTDRWYRQAVDSGSLNLESSYPNGSCSEAEFRAMHIFNLPTHRYITKKTAQRIMTAVLEIVKTAE